MRAPQIFDLSLRDEEPGREATIEIEATATIDVADSTEQLIIDLRKDSELKNAAIRHLQNALAAKSMTIGILTRAARDGGCQQLVAELQAKTAAALLGKDELIAGLRAELDDALRLACVFGVASMVQPSLPMHGATAPAAHECQEWQDQQQPSPKTHRRQATNAVTSAVPSLGYPARAFSAIRSMCPSTLQWQTRQAVRLQNRGHADECLASGYEAGMHQADAKAELGAAMDVMPKAKQALLQKREKASKKMALQTSSSWLQPITTCWAGLGQSWFCTSMVEVAGKGADEYHRPAVTHS